MQRTRCITSLSVALLVLLGLAGCATRGYVRDRVGELRGEMARADGRLQAQADQTTTLAGQAMDRADLAGRDATAAHDLALGRVDFREVSRSSVYFAFDRAGLDDDATSVLDRLVAVIESHPEYVIDLYGFADPAGPDAYNIELGRRRVEAVERYLVERTPGELSRYRTISFGEQLPPAEASRIGEGAARRQVLAMLLEKVPTERTGPEELSSWE